MRSACWCLAIALMLRAGRSPAQAGDADASLQLQVADDERAFKAAQAVSDPVRRLRAMRMFAAEYEDSRYFNRANEEALRLLLKHFPARIAEIRDQVNVNVSNADAGYDRWREETSDAELLAEAGTSGVLLPLAQKLAEDSLHHLNERDFTPAFMHSLGAEGAEPPDPATLHTYFAEARGEALVALSDVSLRQGRLSEAITLLDEAGTLQPGNAEVHALRGEIALAQHREADALTQLEQAQVTGELTDRQRAALLTLYRRLHGGSEAGLSAELDARYAALFPLAFTPPARAALHAGHTVLLELFTGSGCAPCVAADAAEDAVLQQYPRDQVVALSFDQHIPLPDPLANPASVARGELFGVTGTPVFALDGRRIAVGGGSRDDSAEVYRHLSRLLDVQLSRPSGVLLRLSAVADASGTIHARADVKVEAGEALHAATASETAALPGDALAAAVRAKAEANLPPRLAVVFALVENDVRYSGENGVRFHQVVVRSVQGDSAAGQPVMPGSSGAFEATFDPAAVRQQLAAYLAGFERTNTLFGQVRFTLREATLQPGQLAVAAWVQDTVTHHVLQAAYAPVEPAR